MKTFALTITTLGVLLVTPGAYAGTYDGVWRSPFVPATYFVVRHADESGLIGVAMLSATDGTWDAMLGNLSGAAATFDGPTLLGSIDIRATVEFSSPDGATMTVQDCVPLAFECEFPLGIGIPFEKFL